MGVHRDRSHSKARRSSPPGGDRAVVRVARVLAGAQGRPKRNVSLRRRRDPGRRGGEAALPTPPVSGKLSPPPRSGVRAFFFQGARSGKSCDLHEWLQSEDGAADVVAGRDLGDRALEGGGGLAVAALALAACGSYGASHDEGTASRATTAGRGVAVRRREGADRDGGGGARTLGAWRVSPS